MRAQGSGADFCNYLLQVGNGEVETLQDSDLIEIPSTMVVSSVIDVVYGSDFSEEAMRHKSGCAILAPKNDHCDRINDEILNKLPSEARIYLSIDSVVSDEDADHTRYPIEFLNSVSASGLPQHALTLKSGAVVILLRNLNVTQGLMNGTRMQVVRMHNHCLNLEVLTGCSKGQRVFLPRLDLTPSNNVLPFTLKSRQFPIKLAYAMTINKAQGQTLDKVGLYLPSPVFPHGQPYVTMSRVCSADALYIQVDQTEHQGMVNGHGPFTKNIVYEEMLV